MPLPERSYIVDPALSLEDTHNFPISSQNEQQAHLSGSRGSLLEPPFACPALLRRPILDLQKVQDCDVFAENSCLERRRTTRNGDACLPRVFSSMTGP